MDFGFLIFGGTVGDCGPGLDCGSRNSDGGLESGEGLGAGAADSSAWWMGLKTG